MELGEVKYILSNPGLKKDTILLNYTVMTTIAFLIAQTNLHINMSGKLVANDDSGYQEWKHSLPW